MAMARWTPLGGKKLIDYMKMNMQMKMKTVPEMQMDFFRMRMKTLTQIKMKRHDRYLNTMVARDLSCRKHKQATRNVTSTITLQQNTIY